MQEEIVSVQNKSQDLGSVVRNSFLKTALIPILIVELLLLCLYFFSVHYITEKNLGLMRSNVMETVSEMTKIEAKNFDDQLREISRNSRSLQVEHQTLFNELKPLSPIGVNLDLKNSDLYQNFSTGDVSVFVSSKTELTQEIQARVLKTKAMDARFATLVDNNPNIVAAYFNFRDNIIRAYPVKEDFHEQFPRDFDLSKYNFYYPADEEHNPTRNSVWTSAYLDPAGRGWMLSSLVPIYKGESLEGVTGLDVTLSTFSKHILSNNLQWNSGALVLDKHGNILTISSAAESYLGLADISDYNAKDGLSERLFTQPKQLNILEHDSQTGRDFSQLFYGNEASAELSLHGEEYLLAKQAVPETGWQLFTLVPLNNVYGPMIKERQRLTNLGMIFIGLSGLFYLLFFNFLRRSASSLANRITKPIAQVSHMITSYESDDAVHKVHKLVNITELDNLLSMNLKIQKAKKRYQKISNEMKIKNKQLRQLAITDQLTQLYNRLKLDEVLRYEVARSKRDNNPLTVAIIDIDKFKLVNDTFGHQIGDSVLIGVAQIMLRNIRSTDIIGRWGGEEFMLIFPNTPLEAAYERANQLRQLIAQASFKPVKQVTVSMGLANCSNFLCEKALIELADNALYEAKENGRNRVEVAPMVIHPVGKSIDSEVAAS